MQYEFKKLEELLWAAAIAGGIGGIQLAMDANIEGVLSDPKTFGLALGGAALRPFLAVFLNALRTKATPS